MRNAFRMFQRIGITVSPNHYYWPVPDYRELESRNGRTEEEPAGLDLASTGSWIFCKLWFRNIRGMGNRTRRRSSA